MIFEKLFLYTISSKFYLIMVIKVLTIKQIQCKLQSLEQKRVKNII